MVRLKDLPHARIFPSRFVTGEFLNATGVATSVERGGEPDIDNAQGQFEGNHSFADREDIRIVVAASELGGFLVPAQAATDALDLVCGNGLAISRSSQHDPSLGLACRDSLGCRNDKNGIVRALKAVGSEVDDLMAEFSQVVGDGLFVGEPRVIAADADFQWEWEG